MSYFTEVSIIEFRSILKCVYSHDIEDDTNIFFGAVKSNYDYLLCSISLINCCELV